jgi:hypothetical protein
MTARRTRAGGTQEKSDAPGSIAVRLVFADNGSFHDVVVHVPATTLDRYERLIDALREDSAVTAQIFVDPRRLVAAYRDA